jgi:hypothetical protein
MSKNWLILIAAVSLVVIIIPAALLLKDRSIGDFSSWFKREHDIVSPTLNQGAIEVKKGEVSPEELILELTDRDFDGLSNEEEEQLGTDPDNADSDDDGLLDGAEINFHKTNPLNPDSDNNGVRDGEQMRS